MSVGEHAKTWWEIGALQSSKRQLTNGDGGGGGSGGEGMMGVMLEKQDSLHPGCLHVRPTAAWLLPPAAAISSRASGSQTRVPGRLQRLCTRAQLRAGLQPDLELPVRRGGLRGDKHLEHVRKVHSDLASEAGQLLCVGRPGKGNRKRGVG